MLTAMFLAWIDHPEFISEQDVRDADFFRLYAQGIPSIFDTILFGRE